MKRLMFFLLALWCFNAMAVLPLPGSVGAPTDPRYCGEPARNADGSIKRSSAALYAFKKMNPCPATLLSYGACNGWSVDHEWPLADGGCDAPHNMHWMPNAIKSCASGVCKDRWERIYYAFPRQKVQLP